MENFKITAKLFYLIKDFKNRNDIIDYFKTILQQKVQSHVWNYFRSRWIRKYLETSSKFIKLSRHFDIIQTSSCLIYTNYLILSKKHKKCWLLCWVCWQWTKTLKWCHCCWSDVLILNFKHIQPVIQCFLLT